MSTYATTSNRELIVCWPTGFGDRAAIVGRVIETAAEDRARLLAMDLTVLSKALWRTYTHSATQERELLSQVMGALLAPKVQPDDGSRTSHPGVAEAAYRVGRALRELADPDLIDRVHKDVAEEVAAVECAGLGKLAGRAAQAVALSRSEASPTQIAAAHAALSREPRGGGDLFRDLEPTAAAVAAAHWLYAAALVASDACGEDYPPSIIIEANDIEPFPVDVPRLVLERMDSGASANEVVVDLIGEAMVAADGGIPHPRDLLDRVGNVLSEASDLACGWDEEQLLQLELIAQVRPWLLHPLRPAQDLLADLLAGIHACWLVYVEHVSSLRYANVEDFDKDIRQVAEELLSVVS